MSNSSAVERRLFDPVFFGSKPDFLIKTTNPNNYSELLFAEVKHRRSTIKAIHEDLISLGKTMKSSIDKLVEEGFEDMCVYGLHVAGCFYLVNLKFHEGQNHGDQLLNASRLWQQ
ncbi:5698_t:CDS:2 [Entrophospora sp. SA101]|nr:5698_t:CDS:2 [Entrophospora sp. SA101]CAJ0908914.1 13868_t:CDS:2 [Entrophospora sp. SA101]